MSKWLSGTQLKKLSDFKPVRELSPDILYCPFCGNEAYWDTDYGQQEFDFCPYCGEDMRGTYNDCRREDKRSKKR